MVDQSTNRRSIRQSSQKPPPSRSQSSQSLPHSQHSTRVTRSRSRDFSDAEVRELVPRVKRRKAAYEEENVVNSSAQVNRVGKKGARSKDPQGNSLEVYLALSDGGWRETSLQSRLTMIQSYSDTQGFADTRLPKNRPTRRYGRAWCSGRAITAERSGEGGLTR